MIENYAREKTSAVQGPERKKEKAQDEARASFHVRS